MIAPQDGCSTASAQPKQNHDCAYTEACEFGPQPCMPLADILVLDSHYTNMSRLRIRLKKELGWEHKCSTCKNTEWNGQPIPIQIDHINGDHFDNRIENLRFLCPNCHAQTDTYCGKNMKICRNKKLKQQDSAISLTKQTDTQIPRPRKYICVDCKAELGHTMQRV